MSSQNRRYTQNQSQTIHQKSHKTSQIHANHISKSHKNTPNIEKWAGIALKNSHTHPTPTSHLITCFGRYWCSNLRPLPLSEKPNRTEHLVSQLAYCNNSMMTLTNHMVVKGKQTLNETQVE